MSSTVVANPATQQPSKSARKKKAKADAPTKSPIAPVEIETSDGPAATEGATNGSEGTYESPYLKDLYRYDFYKVTEVIDGSFLPQT